MLPICTANLYFATKILGVGFKSCLADCWGSVATDALLALHAGWSALRLARRLGVRKRDLLWSRGLGSFSSVAFAYMCSNCAWSALGASFWTQPGGTVGWPGERLFEILWRLNAQGQAVLLFFAWRIFFALNAAAAIWPSISRNERVLRRVTTAHSLAFGLVTLLPSQCQLHEYVLFGGTQIMFAFVGTWLAILEVRTPPFHI